MHVLFSNYRKFFVSYRVSKQVVDDIAQLESKKDGTVDTNIAPNGMALNEREFLLYLFNIITTTNFFKKAQSTFHLQYSLEIDLTNTSSVPHRYNVLLSEAYK